MANSWLRLWHDMPTDPKWRTISRVSNQPISSVISVWVHMLVCASNATERGRTQGWCDEDIASALDMKVEQVKAICAAMQGRVLDGDYLTGWEKRQPKREDNSSERARAWRDMKKKEINSSNGQERKRTQPNAKKRPDKDKDKEEEYTPAFLILWDAYPRKVNKKGAFKAYEKAIKAAEHEVILSGAKDYAAKTAGQEERYIAHLSTWLNQERWNDQPPKKLAPWEKPENRPMIPPG